MKENLFKKSYSIFPILLIVVGLVLLIYMIKVEDEPGALPLLFILIGTIWLVINRRKNKQRQPNKP